VTSILTLLIVVVAAPLVADAIDRARMRAGCSHKELALSQGIRETQWSQQLHGVGNQHIALDRLSATPPAFRHALLEELAVAWDVPRPAHTIDDVYRVLLTLVPLRMRRAVLASSGSGEEVRHA